MHIYTYTQAHALHIKRKHIYIFTNYTTLQLNRLLDIGVDMSPGRIREYR